MCALEIQRKFQFSNDSIFVLRPFQKKNPRVKTIFSARCARRQQQGGGKNKRKSFLILVSSDRKPQKGVLSQNREKNKARGFFLSVFYASEASMLSKCVKEVQKVCALG